MRDFPVSTCERTFLLNALSDGKRLDGRGLLERRDLEITIGGDWGCVYVSFGDTRVLSRASCSIVTPRPAAPNVGILSVNVELSPMAAPRYQNSQSAFADEVVEVARLLDRTLKESKSIDLESLCIISEEKVWHIRLDVHVLNNEGNILDAASIAALTSLVHFRRPDISFKGHEMTVHSISEKDPVKLSVHHYPICSTFALFLVPVETEEGESVRSAVVSDPSRIEEAVMEGKIVFGINPYREICALHLAGRTAVTKENVLKLASSAASIAKDVVNTIKEVVEKDSILRIESAKTGAVISLASALKRNVLCSNSKKFTEKLVINDEKLKEPPIIDDDKHSIKVSEEGIVTLTPVEKEQEEEEIVTTIKGSDLT